MACQSSVNVWLFEEIIEKLVKLVSTFSGPLLKRLRWLWTTKNFSFQRNGENEVGIYAQCQDKPEIKMILSNTSFLKRHLFRQHIESYQIIFPDSDLPQGVFQKNTLNNYVVSHKILSKLNFLKCAPPIATPSAMMSSLGLLGVLKSICNISSQTNILKGVNFFF